MYCVSAIKVASHCSLPALTSPFGSFTTIRTAVLKLHCHANRTAPETSGPQNEKIYSAIMNIYVHRAVMLIINSTLLSDTVIS